MDDDDEVLRGRRPLWLANRLRALALDHNMCRFCTFNLCLEVHHIRARAGGGSDAINNLITLCPNHHAMAHRGLISAEQFAIALARRKGSRRREGSWLIEYVGRAFAEIDSSDPRAVGELVGRLTIELPEMMAVMFGPEFVTANRDSLLAILRAAGR